LSTNPLLQISSQQTKKEEKKSLNALVMIAKFAVLENGLYKGKGEFVPMHLTLAGPCIIIQFK
jgi:hypothetical protein